MGNFSRELFNLKLATRSFGRELKAWDSTDSTNLRALEHGRAGAAEGAVFLAGHQEQGRGRRGRQWEDRKGSCLLFTLLLRPGLPRERFAQITMVTGLAVARALRRTVALDAALKWPNDVLVQGRKICGILLEQDKDQAGHDIVAVGVGLNVDQAGRDFPPAWADKAVSLRMALGPGHTAPGKEELLAVFLDEAEALYGRLQEEGFRRIQAEWNRTACWIGEQVRAQMSERSIEGMALGLDSDGALLIREESGVVRPLLAGDVSLARA